MGICSISIRSIMVTLLSYCSLVGVGRGEPHILGGVPGPLSVVTHADCVVVVVVLDEVQRALVGPVVGPDILVGDDLSHDAAPTEADVDQLADHDSPVMGIRGIAFTGQTALLAELLGTLPEGVLIEPVEFL